LDLQIWFIIVKKVTSHNRQKDQKTKRQKDKKTKRQRDKKTKRLKEKIETHAAKCLTTLNSNPLNAKSKQHNLVFAESRLTQFLKLCIKLQKISSQF
jgi:hypothetical protein